MKNESKQSMSEAKAKQAVTSERQHNFDVDMSNFNMLNQNAQESISSSVGGVYRRQQEAAEHLNKMNLQENESIDTHAVNIVSGRPEQVQQEGFFLTGVNMNGRQPTEDDVSPLIEES